MQVKLRISNCLVSTKIARSGDIWMSYWDKSITKVSNISTSLPPFALGAWQRPRALQFLAIPFGHTMCYFNCASLSLWVRVVKFIHQSYCTCSLACSNHCCVMYAHSNCTCLQILNIEECFSAKIDKNVPLFIRSLKLNALNSVNVLVINEWLQ